MAGSRVKQSYYKGRLVRSKPEFEDCRMLAEKLDLRIDEIERAVIQTTGK